MVRGVRSLPVAASLAALALASAACERTGGRGAGGAGGEAQTAGASEEAPHNPASGEAGGGAMPGELAQYRLTMDAVRKYARANELMRRNGQEVPELERAGDDAAATLNAFVGRIESIPAARAAVEAAGLAPREYARIGWVLVQASIARWAVRQGAHPDSIVREAGIHPANLRFVEEHEAELRALQALPS